MKACDKEQLLGHSGGPRKRLSLPWRISWRRAMRSSCWGIQVGLNGCCGMAAAWAHSGPWMNVWGGRASWGRCNSLAGHGDEAELQGAPARSAAVWLPC